MRFLTKEEGASFDRLGPEYDKNYRWCSDRSVVNAVEKKKKKKKEKALYGKQSGSFQRTKEGEKFGGNNGTDFISP